MRMLDLYCGEGLAAWGYWLSGRFSEIVGVDIDPEMRRSYSFNFVCADALSLDYDFLMGFDFIHASPPCQAYSKMTPNKSKHPRLIAATHLMLAAYGGPFVMENVEGSGQELKPNLVLSGPDVGLMQMQRRRYFHISCRAHSNVRIDRQINVKPVSYLQIHGGQYVSREKLIDVFGLDCINEQRLRNLSRVGIEQGIPPAFTKLIAESIFPQKFMIA
jgi:DNA (cytosine-5)-methyltransferase 1